MGCADQQKPRVIDKRRAGIGHHCNVGTRGQPGQQLLHHGMLIVLVQTDQFRHPVIDMI